MDMTAVDQILQMVKQYGDRRAYAAAELTDHNRRTHANALELNRRAAAAFEAIRFTLHAHTRTVDPVDAEDTREAIGEVHR
jgi:hypothetical protein